MKERYKIECLEVKISKDLESRKIWIKTKFLYRSQPHLASYGHNIIECIGVVGEELVQVPLVEVESPVVCQV